MESVTKGSKSAWVRSTLRVEHPPSLFEQGGDALGRAAGDVGDLLRGRLGQPVEFDAAVVELDADAVENERMEVHVQAERRVEALADGDAARVRLAHAGETECLLRAAPQ